ncbi:MAG: diphthamide biosynthesis enzyme Dph2 [Candidatus Aenigmarchaeota archaeon]|nr:diphthamide biosynthesis enzyme Dph2 [Candidatus Aenigmarchaeota archaeon]
MKILQIPDGLKRKVLKIADGLGDVLIDCESCFGACDLAIQEAKLLGCDKIVHYGHSKIIDTSIPVEYIELREDCDPIPVLEKDLVKLKEEKIGLISTLQFLDSLEKAKKFLEENGKTVKIGKGKSYPGQILGCDVSSANMIEKEIEAFLYIGSGKFHPLGIALQTEKPVYILDVEKSEITDLKELKEKFLKQKYAAIALAKDARRFGILVSVKPGQLNLELAKKIKNKLEEKGKKAYILVFNEIKPEKLEGLELDCYINTACPRIAIENRTEFKKPILNLDEIESFI